ncbi:hypothetical protein CEXT_616221 [Caerostris extrusa]|uniref:Uncharacterized protein n=1 Tax=Caerostris extrusa TaxID=172846 RepID=A0AAV4NTJ9_CAEEX|nr:hypothetical protein CEXT_616221 [Caerostris extrusa]
MSRLNNTSSFKEIPNVLDEDLKCSMYLHYKMAAEENTMKRKQLFSNQLGGRKTVVVRNRFHLLLLMKMLLRSVDLEAPQIHYSSNPCIILELRYLVIFYRIYNDLVIVHH